MSKATTGFIDSLRSLPELSVDRVLSALGGSAETYERVVRLTAGLLPEKTVRLNALIETDLQLYAAELHGIKGTLSNIGAYALCDMANRLEELLEGGAICRCRAEHLSLSLALTKFTEELTALLPASGSAVRKSGDNGALLEFLVSAESAVDSFDCALALDILSPINEFSYGPELDDAVKKLIFALERFSCDNAKDLIHYMKGLVIG